MIYSCCDGGERYRLSYIITFNFTNNISWRILFKIIQNTLETYTNSFDLRKRRFRMFKTWNNQVVTEANAFVSVGRVRHKAVSLFTQHLPKATNVQKKEGFRWLVLILIQHPRAYFTSFITVSPPFKVYPLSNRTHMHTYLHIYTYLNTPSLCLHHSHSTDQSPQKKKTLTCIHIT